MSSANTETELGMKLAPAFEKSEILPAIAQDAETGEILMLAYMNESALKHTIATGKATYYSRSRQKQWGKGETSGNVQHVEEIRVDCDQDTILLKVKQSGAACHNGFRSCFYRKLKAGATEELEHAGGERLFDPSEVYGNGS